MVLIFIFCGACAFGAALPARGVKADGATGFGGASTEIFLPTTYLQYYKLENPYAICREEVDGKEFVAISHKGAIVVYRDGVFSEVSNEKLAISSQGVPSLQLFNGKYLLFSTDSTIYFVDVTAETPAAPIKIDGVAGEDFSVLGDSLAVCTSTRIIFYTLAETADGNLTATESGGITGELNNKTRAVLQSVNGKTYFYDERNFDTKRICEYDPSTARISKVADAEGVYCLAESGKGDGKLYYSCDKGVYALDLATKEKTEIKTVSETDASTEKDLGRLWKPQGLCLTGKGIWAVDSDINAVQEIDLSDGKYEFTKFAITTNSRAINRLSENAKDVTYYNDTVYALDENRVVVIGNADKPTDERNYHRIDLKAKADKFAAGGGYLAYAYGGEVIYGKIETDKTDENKYVLADEKTITARVSEPNVNGQIYDLVYGDGAFYVLTNALDGGYTHPVILRIDVKTGDCSAIFDQSAKGTAEYIAVDPFDKIYVLAKYETSYIVYAYESGAAKTVYSHNGEVISGEKIVKVRTDFDGKLYMLSDGGKIAVLSGITDENGKTVGYGEPSVVNVIKSENLSGVGNPVSACLGAETRKAYFVFGGLILRTDGDGDDALGVATVNNVVVPSGFGYAYSSEISYGKTIANAKLFKVDETAIDGKYFKFSENGYLTETKGYDYAFVKIDNKYSLAINGYGAAIVRNTDVSASAGVEAQTESYYALLDFSTYSLPVFNAAYASDVSYARNEKVEVVGKLNFNGKTYLVTLKDGKNAFINATFLTDEPIEASGVKTEKSGYVYDKDGVSVYDENHSLIKTVKGKTKVRVLYCADGVAKVRFNDGAEGFVSLETITYDSKDDFIKCVVAILCASSFLVLALFFERKYLFAKL